MLTRKIAEIVNEELKKRYPAFANSSKQRAYSLAKQYISVTRTDVPPESNEYYALVSAVYDNWLNKGLFQG